jgi:phage baseplate assembly protein W
MPENNPILINPVDLQPDVAIGVNLPMDNSNGSALQSTYFTKDQIKANMRSLFSTMIGERVMQPTFGTYLYNLLFEQVNVDLKEKHIRDEVDRAVALWVPEVSINDVSFPEMKDDKKIKIRVEYHIPGYNIEDELTLEVQ